MALIKVKSVTGRKYLIDDKDFDPRQHEKLGEVTRVEYRGSRVFEKKPDPVTESAKK